MLDQSDLFLRASERELLLAVAEAALPAGAVMPSAGSAVVRDAERIVADVGANAARGYRALLTALDTWCWATRGRGFTRLPAAARLAALKSWQRAGLTRRLGLRALMAPLKLAHFASPALYRHLGVPHRIPVANADTRPRFVRERVHGADDVDGHLTIECDVVVVGTGAGGAVVAKELAEQGHAVVMLEEGQFFDRRDFNGRPWEMQRKLYRDGGATISVGNTWIPIPIGRAVGGTTTVNSGTCYRVPSRILRKWRDELGLSDFTETAMAGYFERVESVLGVGPAQKPYLGGVADVIGRGCDHLGYRHGPLQRNAPECDGQGVCCFGCPTEAKRSTNVSYVPLALRAGAEVFCGARVERILTDGGRAVGVVAKMLPAHGAASGDDGGMSGNGRHTGEYGVLTVRARAVVLSCGTLMTPMLLQRNNLCGRSGQLGHNLSIHPAAFCAGVFDEVIDGQRAIPQGYSIEEFHDEGLLFEGASAPVELALTAMPLIGHRAVELGEAFRHTALFGFMIEDSSRGRVRLVAGRPVITYVVDDADVGRLQRAVTILSRVMLAAGARRVHTPVQNWDTLHGEADLARFSRARLRALDFDLSAYHPLGTARMGRNPRRSVVDAEHQTHDVPGLYIVDGASVPSSLGVNPQVTIMAMATRAAVHIGKRLA